jgi:hypothetical protein
MNNFCLICQTNHGMFSLKSKQCAPIKYLMVKSLFFAFVVLIAIVAAVPIDCGSSISAVTTLEEEIETLFEVDTLSNPCGDIRVCQLTCSKFVPGCNKIAYFNLEPILTSNFVFRDAYNKVCIRRVYATKTGKEHGYETFTMRVLNHYLSEYAGINKKVYQYLDENDLNWMLHETAQNTWEWRYIQKISGAPVSALKRDVMLNMFYFTYVLRALTRRCPKKKISNIEFREILTKVESSIIKSMEFPQYQSYITTTTWQLQGKHLQTIEYLQMKNKMINYTLNVFNSDGYKKSSQDYCQCNEFSDWKGDNLRYSNSLTPYLNQMQSRCASIC